MTLDDRTSYLFPTKYPKLYVRESSNTASIEAWKNDVQETPLASSTFTLRKPDGTDLVAATPITLVGATATHPMSSSIFPSTLAYGENYQEIWQLNFSDYSFPITRQAAVGKYMLHIPINGQSILDEMPDALTQLQGASTTLHGWIEVAWGKILRDLFRVNKWPDKIRSSSMLYDVTLEKTFFLIARFLDMNTDSDRWKSIKEERDIAYKAAWDTLRVRMDQDHSGVADSKEMVSVQSTIHRGAQKNFHYYGGDW